MSYVTALLIGLLVIALVVAIRELAGFRTEPAWQDVMQLRAHLMSQVPPPPRQIAGNRAHTAVYCLGLRREFGSAWRLCRFLAPLAGEPGYVGTLVLLKVRFHAVLALTALWTLTGAAQRLEDSVEQLRGLSVTMRTSALAILMNSDPDVGYNAA